MKLYYYTVQLEYCGPSVISLYNTNATILLLQCMPTKSKYPGTRINRDLNHYMTGQGISTVKKR